MSIVTITQPPHVTMMSIEFDALVVRVECVEALSRKFTFS